jgi:hypothetical protein
MPLERNDFFGRQMRVSTRRKLPGVNYLYLGSQGQRLDVGRLGETDFIRKSHCNNNAATLTGQAVSDDPTINRWMAQYVGRIE